MKHVPREIRRFAWRLRRLTSDWLTGDRRRLAGPDRMDACIGPSFPTQMKLEQPILLTDYVEAKIRNIEIAVTQLQNVPVPPGGIFSFWHIVGRPAKARGFLPGRSLVGGRLEADYGGGLCQLSGILYHLSLEAGLKILERHPHSRDIYDDRTRYTPLGADATVSYGFKDLRVLNNLPAPICFHASVAPDRLCLVLCSPEQIEKHIVEFVTTSQADGVCTVETRRRHPGDSRSCVLNVSTYRRLN
jgi:vancomycin resistance protein VanW